MISSRTSGQLTAISDNNVFKQKLNRSAAGIPAGKWIEKSLHGLEFESPELLVAYGQFYSAFHRRSTQPSATIWPIAANMARYSIRVGIHFPKSTGQSLSRPPAPGHPNRKRQQHSLGGNIDIASTPVIRLGTHKKKPLKSNTNWRRSLCSLTTAQRTAHRASGMIWRKKNNNMNFRFVHLFPWRWLYLRQYSCQTLHGQLKTNFAVHFRSLCTAIRSFDST